MTSVYFHQWMTLPELCVTCGYNWRWFPGPWPGVDGDAPTSGSGQDGTLDRLTGARSLGASGARKSMEVEPWMSR